LIDVSNALRLISLIVRTVPKAFSFQAVRACVRSSVIIYWKSVNTTFYKDEVVRFWNQKVKGWGHSEYCQI